MFKRKEKKVLPLKKVKKVPGKQREKERWKVIENENRYARKMGLDHTKNFFISAFSLSLNMI